MPWLSSPLTSPPPPGLRHLNQPFFVIRLPRSHRLSNGKPFFPPLHLLSYPSSPLVPLPLRRLPPPPPSIFLHCWSVPKTDAIRTYNKPSIRLFICLSNNQLAQTGNTVIKHRRHHYHLINLLSLHDQLPRFTLPYTYSIPLIITPITTSYGILKHPGVKSPPLESFIPINLNLNLKEHSSRATCTASTERSKLNFALSAIKTFLSLQSRHVISLIANLVSAFVALSTLLT